MPFQPLNDLVVITLIEAEKKSEGGLILPGASENRVQEGTVVSIGPGSFSDAGSRFPMTVTVGQRVLLSKHAGIETKIDGQLVRLVKESEIYGVVS